MRRKGKKERRTKEDEEGRQRVRGKNGGERERRKDSGSN